MQKLINVLLTVALGVSAWVNIKQHHEIVGAYEANYDVAYHTGMSIYFLYARNAMLDERLCELENE